MAAIRCFAPRLVSDYDAVRAALTAEWSSGQVEGQIVLSSCGSCQCRFPGKSGRADAAITHGKGQRGSRTSMIETKSWP